MSPHYRHLLRLIIVLAATECSAHQPPITSSQQALATSLAGLSIAHSPQMSAFAAHFTTLTNLAISKSFFAATDVNNGMIGIDSSMEQLGPVFLGHPATLGRGQLNVNAIASGSSLDMLDGASLDPMPKPGKLLLNGPDGQFAADLDYHLELQEWAIGLSATYGLTDKLDASLVLPLINSDLKIHAASCTTGETTRTRTNNFGQGDLSLRLKYKLPPFWGFNWATTFVPQFPTGEPDFMHGTGDYWLSNGLMFHRVLVKNRADLTVNLIMDWDLSNSILSQALYGVGTSFIIWPKKLVGIVEFLGRSQFDSINHDHPHDTDVFYVRGQRIEKMPLFGVNFDRADYLDAAFGFRAFIGPLTAFAMGRIHLNDGGLRDSDIEPTIGLGANF